MNMNNDMKSNVFSDENDIFNSGNGNSNSNANSLNSSGSYNGTSSNNVSNNGNVTGSNMSQNPLNNSGTNQNPGTPANPSNNSFFSMPSNDGNGSNISNSQNIPNSQIPQNSETMNSSQNVNTSNQVNPSNVNLSSKPTPNMNQNINHNTNQANQTSANPNQIPVSPGLEMPKLNGDETIGMMKKDTQKSPVAMLILFVVLIAGVFLVPEITPYFSNLLKIFNIDDNSSIYDDNRKDNTSEDKSNTNKDQNNNNTSNEETKTTYYDLKEETEITFGNLKISNLVKTTENNNFYISYKILNNGETSYSFKEHKIYFDFYNDTKTYLGRILVDTDSLASKGEITLKSIISETEYNNATSLEVLERTAADYQSVTLKNNKLTCTNSNHSIIYTFNSNNLIGLDDTFNYTFIVNDEEYAKYSLDTQNTVNDLNHITGVSAGFVSREAGFTKTVRIDYSAAEEDFTKYDRIYYPKNEKASTINYELESIGYKCD